MFVARLICSDSDCTEESLLEAESLEELEALACDCGCVMEIVAWPDWVEPRASSVVISLPARAVQERRAA